MTSHNKDSGGASCAGPGGGDFRCLCGSLMAKIVKEGLEIKCKRCKRIQYIPFSRIALEGAWPKSP